MVIINFLGNGSGKYYEKILSILAMFMVVLLSSCKSSNVDELYNYGIEMTTMTQKMIKNQDYIDLIQPESDLDIFVASDYDSPIRVFAASNLNYEKYISTLDDAEKYNNLPEDIKQQLYNRVLPNIDIILNNNYMLYPSIISTFKCFMTFESSIKEDMVYIYLFETGKTIIVKFEKVSDNVISATSNFFPTEAKTLSEFRDLFEIFDAEVEDVTSVNNACFFIA